MQALIPQFCMPRPSPAKERVHGISNRHDTNAVIRFALSVWECISRGFKALTSRVALKSDIARLKIFPSSDLLRFHGMWMAWLGKDSVDESIGDKIRVLFLDEIKFINRFL